MTEAKLRDWLRATIEPLSAAKSLGLAGNPRIDRALQALRVAEAGMRLRQAAAAELNGNRGKVTTETRYLRIVSQLTTAWTGYDQILAAIGDLHGDAYNKAPTFGGFLKCDSRSPLTWSLGAVVRRYRWPVAVGYTIRNALVHGGRDAGQRDFVDRVLHEGLDLVPHEHPDERQALEAGCAQYDAAQDECPGDEPWSWQRPLREILDETFDMTDEMLGMCVHLFADRIVRQSACVQRRTPPKP